jgi:hypothetical protein
MASALVSPDPNLDALPTAAGAVPSDLDPTGLAKLQAAKAQSPGGKDMSDAQFAVAMHEHYYNDIPMADYLNKVGLNRGDVLYELREPGDAYGDYLRKSLATPGQGETADQAAQRQGGSLPVRRAGPLEGSARALVQGGTMGWGAEAMAAAEAGLDPLVHGDSGKDFGQRYQAYHGREEQLVDNFRKDNPVLAYGSEIAGAIPSSMAAGGELAGQGTSAAGRLLTRFGVGAGQGAVYGAGAESDDRLRGAGSGALLGGGLDVGLGAVQDAVQAAIRSSAGKRALQQAVDAAPKAADLKSTAQASYRAADNSGVAIKPTATAILNHDLGQILTTEGLMNAGKMVGGYGLVRKAMKHLDNLGGQPVTMKQLQRLEESFQDVAASSKAGEGRVGKLMLDTLDSYMDGLPQGAYQGANGEQAAANWAAGKAGWTGYKRTKAIEDAIYSARTMQGGTFATRMRGQVGQLLRANRKKARFSDPEIAAMEQFVEGGPVGELMRSFAGHGGLPATLFGHAVGGVAGTIGMPIAAAAARVGLDKGARQAANRIAAEVATGGLHVPQGQPQTLNDLSQFIPGLTNPEGESPRRQLEISVFGGKR